MHQLEVLQAEPGVNSRSMLKIMGAFSTYLNVPAADLEADRALPAFKYD